MNEYDDELDDYRDFEEDEEEEDEGELEDDAGEKDEIVRIVTQPPVDLARLQRSLNRVPTRDSMFRDLITVVVRLQQSHGDADAALAHLLQEIEQALRAHVLVIHRDPGGWLLSILATMAPDVEAAYIRTIISELEIRQRQLQRGEGDDTGI